MEIYVDVNRTGGCRILINTAENQRTVNKLTTMILIAVALVPVMTAYADHVDNHIWLETAEGSFITATETALDKIDNVSSGSKYDKEYGDRCDAYVTIIFSANIADSKHPRSWAEPETMTINKAETINQRKGECGNKNNEEAYLRSLMNLEYFQDNPRTAYGEILSIESLEGEIPFKKHHECLCGYWYSNTIQDEYTYTIIDLPRDREIPPNYKQIVSTGIQAGFDRWADINDINFRYTDSRLQADIVIQQQIGNGRAYGNANLGCLFDEEQCTIQLFTDVNVGNRQTLTNTQSIEWTVAHEFGHLIGLPHHIEPDHIMNTVHANDVRDYYEVRNINVPRMTEPTYEQRLLENDNDYLDYANYIPTDIDGIMKHSAVTEFVEFMKAVLYNMTESDRALLWLDMVELLADAIFS